MIFKIMDSITLSSVYNKIVLYKQIFPGYFTLATVIVHIYSIPAYTSSYIHTFEINISKYIRLLSPCCDLVTRYSD